MMNEDEVGRRSDLESRERLAARVSELEADLEVVSSMLRPKTRRGGAELTRPALARIERQLRSRVKVEVVRPSVVDWVTPHEG